MARFGAEDVDRYGGQGGGGFFSLKDDGDTAEVRFLYNGIDDVQGMSVHTIKEKVNGKEIRRYVNCLREYNQPIDDCPFCKAGYPVQAKLFVPIYDVASDTTKTWERGKKFFAKISHLCSRYSKKGEPLVSHIFEVSRIGKAGDQTTTYEVDEIDQDDTKLEDLPEAPSIGGLVWEKTADDMEYYLQEGQFPPTGDEEEGDERPIRRRERSERSNGRRTPANNRNRGDAF